MTVLILETRPGGPRCALEKSVHMASEAGVKNHHHNPVFVERENDGNSGKFGAQYPVRHKLRFVEAGKSSDQCRGVAHRPTDQRVGQLYGIRL